MVATIGGVLSSPGGTLTQVMPPVVNPQGTYDQVVLADNPVGYFPLTNGATVTDLAGSGRTATTTGSPTATTLPNGDPAVAFDGATQYAAIPDADPFSVSTTGQLTVEVWYRPDVLDFPHPETDSDGPLVYPLYKGTTSGAAGDIEYAFRMYGAASPTRPNRTSAYLFSPGGGLGAGSYVQETLTAGQWIHLVAVFDTVNKGTDGWGTVTLYKNGAQRDQDTLGDPYDVVPGNRTSPIYLGTHAPGRSFFQGAMGKVAIYGYALTPTQVATHYAAMTPHAPAESISYVGTVGAAQNATSGTTLTVPVTTAIPVGDTIVVYLAHAYTSGGPHVADSRGNTYTSNRSAPNTATTLRSTILSTPVTTALQPGDTVTITTSVAVVAKAATVVQFTGLLTVSPVDTSNSGQAAAATAGTGGNVTTTNAHDLIVAMVGSLNPVTDSYTESTGYTQAARAGTNTGGAANTNVTVDGAYRIVTSTGTYQYRPTFGTATDSVGMQVALKGA